MQQEIISYDFFEKYPELKQIEVHIKQAINVIYQAFKNGNKVLICGNGGSAADSEHIVAELMKDFLIKRPLRRDIFEKIHKLYPLESSSIIDKLQESLPAISLTSQTSFITAYSNDVSFDMVFAQQVYGYGKKGDVLIGITTSGNSKNVINSFLVANALNITTISFTGDLVGRIDEISDVLIKVPYNATKDIQEKHLPIYHEICKSVEKLMFDSNSNLINSREEIL